MVRVVARRRRADRARQVADLLRRQIVLGQFPHGQLPLEAALAREFATSRNTVREALHLLREEGLVERCPGVGTTVAAEKYPHGLHRLLGLAETLHEHGEVTNQVRTMTLIEPPATVGQPARPGPRRTRHLPRTAPPAQRPAALAGPDVPAP